MTLTSRNLPRASVIFLALSLTVWAAEGVRCGDTYYNETSTVRMR